VASLEAARVDDRETAAGRLDGTRRLTLLLAAEVILLAILRLPYDLGFTAFAFGDRGSWLTVDTLVASGRLPAIDFGYPYGLLPIWLSRGWFSLFGATPVAYQAANLLITLTMAWAFARAARALRVGKAGTALMIVGLPIAIQSSYPSMAHALEAALLCNAIAEQIAGRRRSALALATAGAFAKPSMSYLYGVILIAFTTIDLYRSGAFATRRQASRAIGRELGPAMAISGALALILGFSYGRQSLVSTLMPFNGIKDYVAFNFGFFHGLGRYFWYGTPVREYFISVIGFWFAASLWVILAGITSLWRLMRRTDESSRARDEAIVAAATLHIVFVTMFFGGPSSWAYYSYVLVMGAVAACHHSARLPIYTTWLLVGLAVSANTTMRANDFNNWKARSRTAPTAHLWASGEMQSEWQAALTATGGDRVALLSSQGGAPLLLPELERNRGFAYLTPGLARPEDLARAFDEFKHAATVIEVIDNDYGYGLTLMPELAGWTKGRPVLLRNGFFAVYGRAPD
jgi:hypothetical protein